MKPHWFNETVCLDVSMRSTRTGYSDVILLCGMHENTCQVVDDDLPPAPPASLDPKLTEVLCHCAILGKTIVLSR